MEPEFFPRARTPSAYSIHSRPSTVSRSRDLALLSLRPADTAPPTAATFIAKTDEGVKAAHFHRSLRNGRSLGASSARPQWPRPAQEHESMTAAEVEHEAYRHWSCLSDKHDQHLRTTARVAKSAKASVERARRAAVESPPRHLAEVDRGRALLEELVASTLEPAERGRAAKTAALHTLWERHVYAPIHEQLQHRRTGRAFTMHEEQPHSAEHRATRSSHVLSAPEIRSSLERVDPSNAYDCKLQREKTTLSNTKHAVQLARQYGAVIHADGSYELPAPRCLNASAPRPHELDGAREGTGSTTAADRPTQQGIATYYATEDAFRRRVAEVRAELHAKGAALASLADIDLSDGGATSGSGGGGPLLAGSRTARVMLRPEAWGQVQIRDTTFVHEWPAAGHGLLPSSDPTVRAVAEHGARMADDARLRVWPHGAPQLSPGELARRLRDELAPMVGRGKLRVSGPAADGLTSWEAARGRGRHPELAARLSEDHVKPLIRDEGAGVPRPPAAAASAGRRSPSLRASSRARGDHVGELIRADEQAPAPAPPLPRYHAHRAAVDSVGPLLA